MIPTGIWLLAKNPLVHRKKIGQKWTSKIELYLFIVLGCFYNKMFFSSWSWYYLEFGFLKAKNLWGTFLEKTVNLSLSLNVKVILLYLVKTLYSLSLLFLLMMQTYQKINS